MTVLDSLREGGRMVGIVSHVAELRQRIPAQIRVHKAQAGQPSDRPRPRRLKPQSLFRTSRGTSHGSADSTRGAEPPGWSRNVANNRQMRLNRLQIFQAPPTIMTLEGTCDANIYPRSL